MPYQFFRKQENTQQQIVTAYITFKQPSAADSVLRQQIRQPFYLRRRPIRIENWSQSTSQSQPSITTPKQLYPQLDSEIQKELEKIPPPDLYATVTEFRV